MVSFGGVNTGDSARWSPDNEFYFLAFLLDWWISFLYVSFLKTVLFSSDTGSNPLKKL